MTQRAPYESLQAYDDACAAGEVQDYDDDAAWDDFLDNAAANDYIVDAVSDVMYGAVNEAQDFDYDAALAAANVIIETATRDHRLTCAYEIVNSCADDNYNDLTGWALNDGIPGYHGWDWSIFEPPTAEQRAHLDEALLAFRNADRG